tara:strand:+ start:73 stop:369 length:297 start_codon:yes stop_codon:yes gene_type:complete
MGHILTENRNGLIVEAEVTEAGTSKEWDAGTTMLAKQGTRPGRTVGADKGYDTLEFVEGSRGLGITPHVAALINERRAPRAIKSAKSNASELKSASAG